MIALSVESDRSDTFFARSRIRATKPTKSEISLEYINLTLYFIINYMQ